MSASRPDRVTLRGRPHRVALFGGSFDPIHAGHLAVARAALKRFHLDEVHFIPSGRPPHKHRHVLAPFPHRYAMVALACADHPSFFPSLAEAGADLSGQRVRYSIETVRHFRRLFHRSADRLFFILGADSFLHIRTWKDYQALLGSCDFIVANRPGFSTSALRRVIPSPLLGQRAARGKDPEPRTIALRRTKAYLLDTVASHISATQIRRRLREGQSIRGLVPQRVEEYICKQALYR